MDLQTARLSLALDEFEVPTPQKPSVPELSAYASVVLTDLPRSLDLPMGSFLLHITKNRLVCIPVRFDPKMCHHALRYAILCYAR